MQQLSEALRPRPAPSPCRQLHYTTAPRGAPLPPVAHPTPGSARLEGPGAVSSPFSAVGMALSCLVPPAAPWVAQRLPGQKADRQLLIPPPTPHPPPAALGARGGGEQDRLRRAPLRWAKGRTGLLTASSLGELCPPRDLGSGPVPRVALGLHLSLGRAEPGVGGEPGTGLGAGSAAEVMAYHGL